MISADEVQVNLPIFVRDDTVTPRSSSFVETLAGRPARVMPVPSLLRLAGDAVAELLLAGDPRVVAAVGDLHRDVAESVALAYFALKLKRDDDAAPSPASSRPALDLPLPTSSCHLPALRALAESDALSPTTLALARSTRTLSRSGLSFLHLAGHSLRRLAVVDCEWLANLDFVRRLPALAALDLSGCVALPSEALAALAVEDDDKESPSSSARASVTRASGRRKSARVARRRGGAEREGELKNKTGGAAPPRLASLTLAGCASLTDAIGAHLARLPASLRRLDLTGCRRVGNLFVDTATYEHRLAEWRGKRARGVVGGARGGSTSAGRDSFEGHPNDEPAETPARDAPESPPAQRPARGLGGLETLLLGGTRVGDVGAAQLASLPRLRTCDARACAGVGRAGIDALEAAGIITSSPSRSAAREESESGSSLVGGGGAPSPDDPLEDDDASSPGCARSRSAALATEGWTAFLRAVREEEEAGFAAFEAREAARIAAERAAEAEVFAEAERMWRASPAGAIGGPFPIQREDLKDPRVGARDVRPSGDRDFSSAAISMDFFVGDTL